MSHPKQITERYSVLSLLGEGGMGAVYRCLDEKTKQEVALKTLSVKMQDNGEALWRFRREFVAMRRLEHPHCVRAYDFGQSDNAIYFTMEFIDGPVFTQVKRPEEVLPLSLEVLSALDYIHSQGIIHRDLKPHNVLVADRPSRRAVLTDFGIAKVLGEDHQLTADGGVLGTLAYLSPEQAEGKPVDPRADLYSFGVLLYESLLGRYPYVLPDKRSPLAYLKLHAEAKPIPPSEARPGISGELESLLLSLLEKDPAKRPPSAAAVFERLRPFTSVAPSVSLSGGRYLLTPRFVGRDKEMSQLKEGMRRLQDPNAPYNFSFFVGGDAGMGKSRILEELAADAAKEGFLVLRGAADASPQPYAAWAGPIRQLFQLDNTSPAREEQSSQQELNLLGKILPELRAVVSTFQVSNAPSVEEASQERWAMLRGVSDLMAKRATQRKICVLLEDLHLVDEGSLELLEFLSRAVAKSQSRPLLLVVGSYRADEVNASHPLRQTLSQLLAEGFTQEILLSPLSLEASVSLVSSALGMSANDQIQNIAQRFYQATSGNPFYICELLKNLIADGRMSRTPEGWMMTSSFSTQSSLLPENLKEALRRRLVKLPPEVRELLEIFAAAGRIVGLDVLLRASGVGEEELLNRLDDAVRAKLIEEVEAGASAFRFLNEPVRETLYDDLPPGRRRILHSRIASALEDLSSDPGDIGRHLSLSGEKERARVFLIKAGDNALQAFDGAQAALAYEEAIKISGDADLEEKLGRAYDLNGKVVEAEQSFAKALARGGEIAEKSRRLRSLAEVKRKRGALAEAAASLEEAMTLLGKPLPKSRVGVFGSIVSQGLRRAVHNMGIKGQVKEEEREVEAQVVRLAASLAHTLYYVDYDKSVAAHLYMLNQAERLGPSEELALAYLYHGAALGTTGDFKDAQEFLSKGKALAQERKARPLVERAGAYEVWLSWTQGDVNKSALDVDSILDKSSPKDPFDLATVLYVGAASRVAKGELSKAAEHTKALARLAAEAQSLYTRGTSQLHQGILHVYSFELEAAIPALEEAKKAFTESGGRVYAVAAAAYLGLALLRKGEIDKAISILEEAISDMERFHVKDPLVLVHPFLAEAFLARAKRQKGDAKARQKDLSAALKSAELGAKAAKLFPIQMPTVYRVMALVEWEMGKQKDARRLLEEGLTFAKSKGMSLEEELLQLALDKEMRATS